MPNFQVDLNGQTALVTGAGQGTGKAIALALAAAGASVVVNDLNPDRVDTLVDEMQAAGYRVAGVQGDISNRFQMSNVIERARDAYGRIHILVNAVGIYKCEPLTKIDEWDWRRQIEVNITGTFFAVQLMSRVMADEGGGIIVNIASTAGHPNPLAQAAAGYVTGKAGIIGLTKQAARELAASNVRVNAVCPGNIAEPDMPQPENPTNALTQLGTPEDIANVALFLCSDAARFITGQAINVDGGESYL